MSEKGNYSSLSVIDSVDLTEVSGTMQKIAQFQQVVKTQLKQNHDYGILPGTPKPTLLKPGAEKIVMLLGLRSEFDVVDATRDFEKGFFQYQVKCSLYRGDMLITQGLGAANNREKKYARQDPFTVDNTILKMSKKRSLVDAALMVGSLSDLFSQDLEDMDLSGEKASTKKRYATDQDGAISGAQAKRIFAIAKGDTALVKDVMKQYGYEKSGEIKKTEYEAMCKVIENMVAEKESADIEKGFNDAVPPGSENE